MLRGAAAAAAPPIENMIKFRYEPTDERTDKAILGVGQKGEKKIMQGPPPPSFGQNPKEQQFFSQDTFPKNKFSFFSRLGF